VATTIAVVDEQRFGRIVRAIRHKKGWRQADVATRARLSQDLVSRVELGGADALTVAALRAIGNALGARVTVSIAWNGADLDRLLDEGHATLVGAMIDVLAAAGWDVRTEVSYSVFGERGSYDILAWHAATRSLLVVEVKTELASVEATIRKLDEKVRLAPRIVKERFGWEATYRSHVLVLPERSTERRRVDRHRSIFDGPFRVRSREFRSWIATPDRAIGALLFLSLTTGVRGKSGALGRKRVRLSRREREAEASSAEQAA
jgi:transcriptional regulator with XRE-family HTH domain